MSERFYTQLGNIEFGIIKSVELAKKFGNGEFLNKNHYSNIIDQISVIQADSKEISNIVQSSSNASTIELNDIISKSRNKKKNFRRSVQHQSLSKQINEILNPSEISNNEYNDDDMSIQADISPIDPITKRLMEHPVKNKICNHRYEKTAILESIKYNSRFRCPVVGCANKYFITENNLEDDHEFRQQIQRSQN